MVLPRLIHPILCTVERIDKATTIYDPDAREPIQAAARHTEVQMYGQPRWISELELSTAQAGAENEARGYVLFRQVDLDAEGFDLAINDRITMQGHLADEVYITRIQPMGHYPDQSGASLIKAWFTDRKPSKERD